MPFLLNRRVLRISPLGFENHKSRRSLVSAFFVAIPVGNLLLALALAANAQSPLTPSSALETRPSPAKPKPAVAYLFPEQITVPANKPASVDLHFRVADGLHINSHTPREEALIPTTLRLPETSGVRLAKADFPPGTDFTFALSPQEKLSVYTGDFTIHAQFVATPGDHLVEATLHYQACNNEQCMPPRSIPVAIDVIAK